MRCLSLLVEEEWRVEAEACGGFSVVLFHPSDRRAPVTTALTWKTWRETGCWWSFTQRETDRYACSKATLDFLHPREALMMWLPPQLFGPEVNHNRFIYSFIYLLGFCFYNWFIVHLIYYESWRAQSCQILWYTFAFVVFAAYLTFTPVC